MTDGDKETVLDWILTVADKNRAPTLEKFDDLEVEETESIQLKPVYSDPDKEDAESLTITYSEPFNADGFWETDYESAGGYPVSITVSDGETSVTEMLKIIVRNKNREPIIADMQDIAVYESQKITLKPSVTDPDGDKVTIEISDPIGDDGIWETGYDDAGEYKVTVTAKDDKSETSKSLKIKITNVNRAPVISAIEDLTVTETDLVDVDVDALDPDGDDVIVTFSSPLDNEGKWTTDFDSAGEYTVTVTASDGDEESTTTFKITVKNKNRPPVIFGVSN